MKELTAEQNAQIEQIKEIIGNTRRLSARFRVLIKKGYNPVVRLMGSGGVGQVRVVPGEVRVQVSSGWGRYNYAYVVCI